ncbi:MAG: hypothetical protein ABIF40_04410 [archaeon]
MNQYLIILKGSAGGVGKSTVGNRLAEKIDNSMHIDVDTYKHPQGLPSLKWRKVGRQVVDIILENAFEEYVPLIISESFSDFGYFEYIKQTALNNHYNVYSFFLEASLDSCLERNAHRKKRLPDEHIAERYDLTDPLACDIVIQNDGCLDTAVDMIIRYVATEQERSDVVIDLESVRVMAGKIE